jgi:hypothetical protein
MYEMVCCNIVTLILLCAFVGLNCNNLIVMHRMGNVRVLTLPVFTMLNTKISTPINVTYPTAPLINNTTETSI